MKAVALIQKDEKNGKPAQHRHQQHRTEHNRTEQQIEATKTKIDATQLCNETLQTTMHEPASPRANQLTWRTEREEDIREDIMFASWEQIQQTVAQESGGEKKAKQATTNKQNTKTTQQQQKNTKHKTHRRIDQTVGYVKSYLFTHKIMF